MAARRRERLAITGFYERFDDLIQLTLAPTLRLLVGENVPDAGIWGFELEGAQGWAPWRHDRDPLHLYARRDLDTGNVLPRGRTIRRASTGMASPARPCDGLELLYLGSHFDDSDESFRAGDAVYLNAQLSYRISPALRVYLRGENLNDDRTPEIFSFTARGAAVFGGCGWISDTGEFSFQLDVTFRSLPSTLCSWRSVSPPRTGATCGAWSDCGGGPCPSGRGRAVSREYGRTGFRRNFPFKGIWNGRPYANQQAGRGLCGRGRRLACHYRDSGVFLTH